MVLGVGDLWRALAGLALFGVDHGPHASRCLHGIQGCLIGRVGMEINLNWFQYICFNLFFSAQPLAVKGRKGSVQ